MIKWLHEWKVFSKWDMGNTLSLDVTQSTLIEFNYTKRRGTVMQSYTLPSSFSFLSNFRKDVSVHGLLYRTLSDCLRILGIKLCDTQKAKKSVSTHCHFVGNYVVYR